MQDIDHHSQQMVVLQITPTMPNDFPMPNDPHPGLTWTPFLRFDKSTKCFLDRKTQLSNDRTHGGQLFLVRFPTTPPLFGEEKLVAGGHSEEGEELLVQAVCSIHRSS